MTEIWTREEAFSGPHSAEAPDLTLILRDGGLVSILPAPNALSRRPMVSGAHRPVGIFAAKGPEIRRGYQTAGELSILDVAPTVLHSLGLAVPMEMQGRLPEEIYKAEALRARPVQKTLVHAATVNGNSTGGSRLTAEDEQVIMERLRELGYVE